MTEYRPPWKMLLGCVAFIAVAASALIFAHSQSQWSLFFPILATASAANAAVGIAWFAFHKWLWKWEPRRVRIFAWVAPQPNFNGRWIGVIDSPHFDALIPVAIEIRQSFTTIDGQIWTGTNRSYTVASSLLCSPENSNFRLLYTYQAAGNPGHNADGHEHRGTVILELLGSRVVPGSKLRGSYFTNRDMPKDSAVKKASGEIYLKFESRKTIDDLGPVSPDALSYLARHQA